MSWADGGAWDIIGNSTIQRKKITIRYNIYYIKCAKVWQADGLMTIKQVACVHCVAENKLDGDHSKLHHLTRKKEYHLHV